MTQMSDIYLALPESSRFASLNDEAASVPVSLPHQATSQNDLICV